MTRGRSSSEPVPSVRDVLQTPDSGETLSAGLEYQPSQNNINKKRVCVITRTRTSWDMESAPHPDCLLQSRTRVPS